MEIVSFSINLEHIGDIIDKNLWNLRQRRSSGVSVLNGGRGRADRFHKRVCENLQAAFGIFMTGDVETARKLVRRKPSYAKPNSRRLTAISSGCAKADRKAWRRPRCTSTFSPTSSASIRISAR